MSRTLILVKPDAFERNLTGEVIARFERKGLKIAALKTLTATRRSPTSTTPSTPSGPSSASSSASSPAVRWWRPCWRAPRTPSRPPGS